MRDPLQVNLRRLVYSILAVVVAPTVLLTGIGITVIFARDEPLDLVFGILVTSFASSVIAGAALLIVLARRGAQLARLQETFISRMGHELLTPLAGIRLHTQLLESATLREDARSSVDAIQRESGRLQQLVERTMRWRQIRSSSHLYKKNTISLAEIVERISERVPVGDDVRVTLRESQALVDADLDAIAEAVANLLNNAIKYSGDSSTVELIVRTFGGRAVFAVLDRGPGLGDETIESLAEPFFRSPPPLIPDPGGTGLGLTISRQIALAHGGHLRAAARSGGGTRFLLIVPLSSKRQSSRSSR